MPLYRFVLVIVLALYIGFGPASLSTGHRVSGTSDTSDQRNDPGHLYQIFAWGG
jgi:hypothetical protein